MKIILLVFELTLQLSHMREMMLLECGIVCLYFLNIILLLLEFTNEEDIDLIESLDILLDGLNGVHGGGMIFGRELEINRGSEFVNNIIEILEFGSECLHIDTMLLIRWSTDHLHI
jgi:hypothetical protein